MPSKHITDAGTLQVSGLFGYSGGVQLIRLLILLSLVGILMPAQPRGRRQQPKANQPVETIAADFEGTVRGITSKELVMETADGNTLQFHLGRKTEFYKGTERAKWSAIQVGMHVKVEGKKAPDNSLDAVRVEVGKAK